MVYNRAKTSKRKTGRGDWVTRRENHSRLGGTDYTSVDHADGPRDDGDTVDRSRRYGEEESEEKKEKGKKEIEDKDDPLFYMFSDQQLSCFPRHQKALFNICCPSRVPFVQRKVIFYSVFLLPNPADHPIPKINPEAFGQTKPGLTRVKPSLKDSLGHAYILKSPKISFWSAPKPKGQ